METKTIKNFPGVFSVTQVRMFFRITHLNDGKSVLVGSIPVGNYESPGITACGNHDAPQMIDDKINNYVNAEKLKSARAVLNLTQNEMAEVLMTSPRTYQKWEQGAIPTPGPTQVAVSLMLKYKGAVKHLLGQHT